MSCGTSDADFANATSYYEDQFSMLIEYCNSPTSIQACGYPNGQQNISLGNSSSAPLNLNINQALLGYGNSCTYVLKSSCGYPKFKINGKNLAISVAFNKTQWNDDDDDDDDDDDHNDFYDLHQNSTWDFEHDFDDADDYDWTLPANMKKDYFNSTLNRTVCTETVIFLNVLNLDKSTNVTNATAFMARQLQQSGNAQVSFSVSATGNSAYTTVVASLSVILAVISTLAF